MGYAAYGVLSLVVVVGVVLLLLLLLATIAEAPHYCICCV